MKLSFVSLMLLLLLLLLFMHCLVGRGHTHRLFLERNKTTTPHFPLHVSSSFLATILGCKCIRIVMEKRRIVIRCLSNYHLTSQRKTPHLVQERNIEGLGQGIRHTPSAILMLKLLLSCITNSFFFFFLPTPPVHAEAGEFSLKTPISCFVDVK